MFIKLLPLLTVILFPFYCIGYIACLIFGTIASGWIDCDDRMQKTIDSL